jgi:hypothetical protein
LSRPPIGASAGYYAAACVGVRWAYRAQARRCWLMGVLVANVLTARSIAVESCPAEAIDSIAIQVETTLECYRD